MEQSKDIVLETFKSRISDIGLHIEKIEEDGTVVIPTGESKLNINLDNVRKSYKKDQNLDVLKSLLDIIEANKEGQKLPSWEEAKESVYFSVFPGDFDFRDFHHTPVTDDFAKIYVYSGKNGLTWIDKDQVKVWGVDLSILRKQAEHNMANLLDTATLETAKVDSHLLAHIETDMPMLKSAMLLSDALKPKVEAKLGWPVFCVMPVRDFCYIFSEKDKDFFIGRLGNVVLREYKESGYEVTTEVLKISDTGVEAIGKY